MDSNEADRRQAEQVSLKVRGTTYLGWLSSEISLSLETLAATFSVPVTLIPGSPPDIVRQDEVEVWVGDTRVITGHVLAAEPFYNARECGLRVQGCDRTGDLVRGAAIHRGGQWRGASLLQIAKDLCKPYGVAVVVDPAVAAKANEVIGEVKTAPQETVLDVLARLAKLKALLLSRDALGRVLITRAGSETFPGAIQRGVNVISMDGIGSDANRHSEYIVHGHAEVARDISARATDDGVGRYLPTVISADGNKTHAELQALVDHTAAVRRGHAYGFRYVVEGWTWQGRPWALNQRVQVLDDLVNGLGFEWLIASVRHSCSLREGPVTELVIRPIEAYDIQVGLKSRPKHRNWGNSGNATGHAKGPRDGH